MGLNTKVRGGKRLPSAATALILAPLGLLLGAISPASHSASACTLDGKPTAFADGRRAILTTERDTQLNMRTWAPFSFPDLYRARAAVLLSEDRGALGRVLPRQSFAHPWKWTFGDRTAAFGWTIAHHYARTGTYRITVAAYYPMWQEYIPFDTVRIVVTS